MQPSCGCCFFKADGCQYLPQLSLHAHATILSSTARTSLIQIFTNPSDFTLDVSYVFPLPDGVSVVGFQCKVGSRALHSKVTTKEQATFGFHHAVAHQQSAAILEQSSSENDIFRIQMGNVRPKEEITVEITIISDLKQDAQADCIRYTLPNAIAPRYDNPLPAPTDWFWSVERQGITVALDVSMESASAIRELQSPSHPIKVILGRLSTSQVDVSVFNPAHASVSLHLAREQIRMGQDFVLLLKADGLDKPRALLESHSTLQGQRALMATNVPKFSLPAAKPEVVILVDRNYSMRDRYEAIRAALRVFLKSLPVGIYLNIRCFGLPNPFGTVYPKISDLWPEGRLFDTSSFAESKTFR